jgi:hypothetical protein
MPKGPLFLCYATAIPLTSKIVWHSKDSESKIIKYDALIGCNATLVNGNQDCHQNKTPFPSHFCGQEEIKIR